MISPDTIAAIPVMMIVKKVNSLISAYDYPKAGMSLPLERAGY
jgi:hypothetical protein